MVKKKINATILIKSIVIDEELYPRNTYNWQIVYDYAKSMEVGAKFPKIVVAKYRNVYILVDGRHRIEAIKQLLKKKEFNKHKTPVEVLIGLTKEEILEEAVKRNITHGKSMSVQEKIKVAQRFKEFGYSVEKIGKLVQIPQRELKNLVARKLVNTLSGNSIILKKPMEHMTKESNVTTGEIEYIQKNMVGISQRRTINSLIEWIETNTLDLKDLNLIERLITLQELISKLKLKNKVTKK